ncbi:MAG TPA: SRPBCC family protein [Casimicrobiaceae bacterium]|nr:SRPBCC family protein [Casimicrobiaceae bacterium]
MVKASFRIDIGRAIADVYDVLVNHENDVYWQSAVVESRKLSSGPTRAGTRYRGTFRLLGSKLDVQLEVLEVRPPTFYAFAVTSGPFSFETRVQLEVSAIGTEVNTEVEGSVGAIPQLAAVTLSRIRRKEIERDLGTLKRLMEGGEL